MKLWLQVWPEDRTDDLAGTADLTGPDARSHRVTHPLHVRSRSPRLRLRQRRLQRLCTL